MVRRVCDICTAICTLLYQKWGEEAVNEAEPRRYKLKPHSCKPCTI